MQMHNGVSATPEAMLPVHEPIRPRVLYDTPQTPCHVKTNPSRHFHLFVVVRLRIESLCLVAVDAGLPRRAAKAKSRPPEPANVLEFLSYRYVLIYVMYIAEIEFLFRTLVVLTSNDTALHVDLLRQLHDRLTRQLQEAARAHNAAPVH